MMTFFWMLNFESFWTTFMLIYVRRYSWMCGSQIKLPWISLEGIFQSSGFQTKYCCNTYQSETYPGGIWVLKHTLDGKFLQFAMGFREKNHKIPPKYCRSYKKNFKHHPQKIPGYAPDTSISVYNRRWIVKCLATNFKISYF